MSHPLPRLRLSLDFMPSPDPERPGLLIRDPYHFSDTMLLIPPPLVPTLACFDGEQTTLELRENLVRITGQIQVGELEANLFRSLTDAGFLEDEKFEQMRAARMGEFERAEKREPSHVGSAYPETAEEVREQLAGYLSDGAPAQNGIPVGIAAPHVSPFGGWESYRDAYAALPRSFSSRTFVILGTSHYGEPDRFGLTRKPFVTPLGEAITAVDLVNELQSQAPHSVRMEDYCHAIEHSIEFQVLFLQYLFGPRVRILPILCGSFAKSIYEGGKPEANEDVRRFFGALSELGAREADNLAWVLGIDMAHIGRRYGSPLDAQAETGTMIEVGALDRARIERVNAGDASGFWDLVQERKDDLNWCGSSPLYTFLQCAPKVHGTLRRYQQWNIDPGSVVSFAALEFAAAG
ncbi:MAG TPA: AmmeMemoRadiSam system protein B [Bryobacteraceae bacterium]|nr:AmmeMemoRadiSam system protein B [Bryobacteraceae bacterium]